MYTYGWTSLTYWWEMEDYGQENNGIWLIEFDKWLHMLRQDLKLSVCHCLLQEHRATVWNTSNNRSKQWHTDNVSYEELLEDDEELEEDELLDELLDDDEDEECDEDDEEEWDDDDEDDDDEDELDDDDDDDDDDEDDDDDDEEEEDDDEEEEDELGGGVGAGVGAWLKYICINVCMPTKVCFTAWQNIFPTHRSRTCCRSLPQQREIRLQATQSC